MCFIFWISVFLPGLFPGSLASQGFQHEKIIIRGFDGSPLTADSKVPYSPKRTCGACHDYERITRGYHFQQGRTDGMGKIDIRDGFDPKFPWNLSSGMYGKHSLACTDLSLLAKKVNPSPSEIDRSAFSFIQHCGGCHPGGGFGEYDRDGNLYFDEDTRKLGFEVSDVNILLDGDYTPYSAGDTGYGAPWGESGVSEADCLICHLKGYRWKERSEALRGRFFREAPTVGAGWAKRNPPPEVRESHKGIELIIDYTRKEVSDFENLRQQIVRRPPDENCWACHTASDGRKNGRQWTPESDGHRAKDLRCVTCHPADREHQIAKGNSLQQTVRDDLDNTMHSCEDCHYRGKDKRAPRYRHPFSPRHMKRIACQTCHIPFQPLATDLVYDHAASGQTAVYDSSRFFARPPLDSRSSNPWGDTLWYPPVKEQKGRIVPVKSLVVIYWGNLDEATQAVKPIPLWKIREMKKPPIRDDNNDGILEVNTFDEIKAFLLALRGKDKFGNPVADRPVLMKGGFLYRLDKKGEIEKLKHEQALPLDFSLSHNVVSGPLVIGSRGCKDCHSKNSVFFLRKNLVDPYDEKGKPVYAEAWEQLGISKERLGRLLTEQ